MINHAEAQSLISARMDEPLDPIVARELDAHLATCPQCRAFASQTAAMSQVLHDLPHLPASPRVRREVLDAIETPQTPWTRFQGLFAPGPGSAWSTVAAVLVVGLLSIFVLTRLLGHNGGDDNQPTLLAPSIETTRETDVAQSNPTATAPDGQISAPTLPPTEPQPTATTEEVAPPTSAPTDVPPTDVVAPPTEPMPTQAAPTETAVPVEQPTDVPTAVPAPTEETAKANVGDSGSNAIRIAAGSASSPEATLETPPTDVPTAAATETPVPPEQPTETPVPTDVPTETPVPTETFVPTDVPTETPAPPETIAPTEVPVLTPTPQSPPIEPASGTYMPSESDTMPAEDVTETVPVGPAEETVAPVETVLPPTQESGPPIEPASTQTDGGSAPTIGPVAATPGAEETTTDGTGGPTSEQPQIESGSTPESPARSDDPGTVLGPVDPSARIVASGGSWATLDVATAPQASNDGATATNDAQGGIQVCGASGTCESLALQGDERSDGTPIGWIGSTLIVEQQSRDGSSSYYAVEVGADGHPGDAVPLGDGDSSSGPAYVYGDSLLIATANGWFRAGATDGYNVVSEQQLLDSQALRFYPDLNLIGAIVDGTVVFENVYNGTTDSRIRSTGSDFDLSADGTYVAVSTGTSIEIWQRYGDRISTFTPTSGDGVGSVAWSGDSLLYVDTTMGVVRSIAPSDFGPGNS
ncbi:MAG: zf-HC2 domain-containing protein [Thermomicrobiales bacterium]